MTLTEFKTSLTDDAPPPELPPALQALWRDGRGDWDGAHTLAQADEGGAGDWVHAYLHRKEGDDSNAVYGYERADRSPSRKSLTEEWSEITRSLLG